MRRSAAKQFAREGWMAMPLLPEATCKAVMQAFVEEVEPWRGPLLRQLTSRHEPHTWSVDGFMTNPIVNPHLLAQFPTFCTIEQRTMRACPLVEVVATLLGHAPAMLQSAYYASSRGTKTHVDFNPVDRDRPMVGVWIALEDIAQNAGRFFVYPGSHALPDTPDSRRFSELAWRNYQTAFLAAFAKARTEASEAACGVGEEWGLAVRSTERPAVPRRELDESSDRRGTSSTAKAVRTPTGELSRTLLDRDLVTEEAEAQEVLARIVDRHGLICTTPRLRAGDAVFWDRRLLHGSHVPEPGGGSRNSLLFHFIEADLVAARGLQTR